MNESPILKRLRYETIVKLITFHDNIWAVQGDGDALLFCGDVIQWTQVKYHLKYWLQRVKTVPCNIQQTIEDSKVSYLVKGRVATFFCGMNVFRELVASRPLLELRTHEEVSAAANVKGLDRSCRVRKLYRHQRSESSFVALIDKTIFRELVASRPLLELRTHEEVSAAANVKGLDRSCRVGKLYRHQRSESSFVAKGECNYKGERVVPVPPSIDPIVAVAVIFKE
ncbi:hypothetical protein Tco_0702908 [Tanacetum coccineum]|uniref:Uncharacterized protein n=1 Tax=Tanacetum coccineum TaxID=301880 RepID=A0ABQ4XY50_9ASTR